MSVLLVDGDNLLTIGFYGLKNHFYKGKHIGAIYHFINTLRRAFETYHLDKIVVFWDGEEGSQTRKQIYHLYKENRRSRLRTEEEVNSYQYQRQRVKQYLEELFVRQGEFQYCETDDCIAYYVQNSLSEYKIIYSADGDLTQLVSESTQIFNPSHQKLYKHHDKIMYDHEEICIENVKIVKMLCGDPSDNISGIKNMGIKRLISLFPEIKDKPISLNDIKEKTNILFEQDKNNWLIKNLLTGVTKHGVFGDEFFYVNNKIVSLDEPFLTDDAKENIHALINDNLDQEGRSYKNAMKMMSEDGLFQILPKSDDAFINFFNPFLRLTRKEKNKKPIKIKTMTNQENVTKFEFLLTLENNIVCQRFFNVKDHEPRSRRSMDLHYYVKNICEEISEDLKIKSSEYLIENQGFFMNNEVVEDPKEMEEQYFLLQIKQGDDVFISRIFAAHYYHPKVRYAVDIRPKLRRILADLTEVLSVSDPETTYLQYEL